MQPQPSLMLHPASVCQQEPHIAAAVAAAAGGDHPVQQQHQQLTPVTKLLLQLLLFHPTPYFQGLLSV
jgi:hypothetical protein